MTDPIKVIRQNQHQQPHFRMQLKHAVAEPHKRLEALPVMQRYSLGLASKQEYMAVSYQLFVFWSGYFPAAVALPEDYYQLLSTYLQALKSDTCCDNLTTAAEPINELAFFYVLIGSGLGAKVILKNNAGNDYPKANLITLAENSGHLWKYFVDLQLEPTPNTHQDKIKQDSTALFNALLCEMKNI